MKKTENEKPTHKFQLSNNCIQEFKYIHASIAFSPNLFLFLLINSPDLENAYSLGTEVEGIQYDLMLF